MGAFDELQFKKERSLNWQVSCAVGKAFHLRPEELLDYQSDQRAEHGSGWYHGEFGSERLKPWFLCQRICCPIVFDVTVDRVIARSPVITNRMPDRLKERWEFTRDQWRGQFTWTALCFRSRNFKGVSVMHNGAFILTEIALVDVLTWFHPSGDTVFLQPLPDVLKSLTRFWWPHARPRLVGAS